MVVNNDGQESKAKGRLNGTRVVERGRGEGPAGGTLLSLIDLLVRTVTHISSSNTAEQRLPEFRPVPSVFFMELTSLLLFNPLEK